ncbi:c-type cytochrome [Maribacter algicola]|uniref:C-type cytochrome n=1 Tax=Meishania litoralis TaxID=3434685 RepID=A0ACC7LHC6_9FLAO
MRHKLSIFISFLGLTLFAALAPYQENEAPVVKIFVPQRNDGVSLDEWIPYRITITDMEDGNSEYDEITANDVVLAVQYLPDSSQVAKYLHDGESIDLDVLSWMGSSNCFTCHSAKDKLIGPSFSQIADRYNNRTDALQYLARKITNGTTGTWGNQIMPAQPDLKPDEVKMVLGWILKNSSRPDFNYVSGIEGVFRTPKKIEGKEGKGVFLLMAQYIDHGLENVPESSKKGNDTIVLQVR